MTKISDQILENSLCFISESIDKMILLENKSSSEKEQNLKYAICHLWSGMFLLLKARLSKEHWSLIFKDPSDATKEKLKLGNFQGVDFKACQKRLNNVCEEKKLNEDQKKLLDKLRKKRNQAEYFFVTEDDTAWKSTLGKILALALDFKERWFETSSIGDEKVKGRIENYIEEIRSKCIELKEFVEARLKIIQPELAKRCKREPDRFIRFPFSCQECFQKAVVYGKEYDLLECLFCNHKIQPESYPDYLFELSSNRLDEFECIECGACGEENGIVSARDDKNVVVVEVADNYLEEYTVTSHCLFCQTMLYVECEQCNRVLDKDETQKISIGLCSQCWSR